MFRFGNLLKGTCAVGLGVLMAWVAPVQPASGQEVGCLANHRCVNLWVECQFSANDDCVLDGEWCSNEDCEP